MKVLLVDDERLSLMHMQRLLEEYEEVTIVGAFQAPEQALDQAASLQPDVVFLDIHMPKITGMQMAECLKSICPDSEIVFVSAHDKYALHAFELNAIDYLVKPVLQQRLEKTVTRLFKWRGKQVQYRNSSVSSNRILCFQSIRFQRAGMLPQVPKWRTAKTQELFAYLLHHRGDLVRKGTLMELLWPELDEKRALTQLYSAIYQIRQCLAKMEIDVTIQNSTIREGYILDTNNVCVDTEEWERALAPYDDRLPDRSEELYRLLGLYEGDYLQDHGYAWAENERERLRKLWLQYARLLARRYLAEQGRQEEAAELYERIQEIDPYDVGEGLTLLKLYDEVGRKDKVKDCYRRMTHVFTQEDALDMPDSIVHWYERWTEQRGMNE